MREKLIIGASAGVMQIFQYFEAQRVLLSTGDTHYRIAASRQRLAAMNCALADQAKFKHCCGKITMH